MRILDKREGEMTRSSTVRATDIEANDLGDDKPTSSRSSTRLPFDHTRGDDKEEEDLFDAEAGWYVPVSIFTLPIYLRDLKLIYFFDATKRCSRLSVTVITLFPIPP
eukprot:scaffold167970_cov76-Attheya_sp.AAC.2